MFAECTIQYDTKKGGDICVFVEKQILVLNLFMTDISIMYIFIYPYKIQKEKKSFPITLNIIRS